MTDDTPSIEKTVEEIIQERKDRRRDRRIVAAALSLAFLSVLAVAAVALVFAMSRGRDVTELSTGSDALRQQVEYCARPTTPKNDPQCQTPVAPPAKEITGQQGIQGIQGISGRDGRDGRTPPCLLQANRCVGARGLQGIPGSQGVQGVPGLPGKDGKNGLNGKDGVDGKDGVNGLDGKNGVDGQNGKDGTNGTDGKDGRGIVSQRCNTETQQLEFTYTDAPDTWVPVAGSDCVADAPTAPPTSPSPLLKVR